MKKIISIFIAAFFLFGTTGIAFANPYNITSPANEYGQINSQEDIVSEEHGQEMSKIPENELNDDSKDQDKISIQNIEEASITTFQQLKDAIDTASDGDILVIENDIDLPETIELDKSLTLRAANGDVTLTTSSGYRHFLIAGGEISFTTNGVTLDGVDTAGGIRSDAEHLILDAVITNCRNDTAADRYRGGGVFLTNDLTVIGGEISHNTAAAGGGGIHSEMNCTITINGGYISHNTASGGSGGGINAGNYSAVTINNGEISHNSSAGGGGVNIMAYGALTINGGKISNNVSTKSAGGVEAAKLAQTIVMTGGEISGNTALYGTGGGISTDNALIVDGGIISGNSSSHGGGGIFANNLVVNSGSVTNNSTALHGGGIYTNINALTIRGNSVVKDNRSSQAYHMTDPADIAIHNQNIDATVTWSNGFDYIYNNNDVLYVKGNPVTPEPADMHTVTVISQYLDGSRDDGIITYQVADGDAFHESFEIPDGYELIASRLRSPIFGVDTENRIIHIDSVEQDITVTLEFDKIIYTVKIVTRFNDGSQTDIVQSYDVYHGDFFETTFHVPSGYRLVNYDTPYLGFYINSRTFVIEVDSITHSGEIILYLG